MSPLDLDLGVDLTIVDDPPPSSAATATDTGFLIHSMAQPGHPTDARLVRSAAEARELYAGEVGLLAATDAWFGVSGGSRLYVAPLGTDESASADLFPTTAGPGQLMAPEVVAAADIVNLQAWAWANNKVYIAQAPDNATQAALETLAAAVTNVEGGRVSMLEADQLMIPGAAPGATRYVGASVVKGALMARSDRVTGNPNLAAAGNHTPGAGGVSVYVIGVKNERSVSVQKALAQAQVNSFRTVNGLPRSYGYWTLADLDALPQWWDMGGSRTIMAIRAEEQNVAEEMMFGQVAANGLFLDKYQGALSGVLARYQRLGALFGTDKDPGYRVDVTATVNPVENVAKGLITAAISLRTSPFAAALKLTLTRRAISERIV
jgi:hypothetical protein